MKPTRQMRMRTIAKLVQQKISLANIAKECGIKPQRVMLYLEKMVTSGEASDFAYLAESIPDNQKIASAFTFRGLERLRPVFDDLAGTVPFDDLRLMRIVMMGRRG